MIVILTAVALTMTASRCGEDTEQCHKNIRIVNNSDKTLIMYTSFAYPDSTLNPKNNTQRPVIKPHADYLDYWGCVEGALNNRNEHGVLIYFFIDNDVVENYPLDTISKYRMYLRQYNLTIEGLQKDNWTVTYP